MKFELKYISFAHKLFILVWNLDLDQTIIKISNFLHDLEKSIKFFTHNKKILIQERRLNDLNDNVFSELLTVGNFSLRKLSGQLEEAFFFEMKKGEAVLLKSIKSRTEAIFDLSKTKKLKKNLKKKFKIISSQKEPFLESKDQEDKCVDGVKCFDIISKRFKCCKGFITEMIQKISYDLGFEIELFLTSENEAISEVINKKMQMAVGPYRLSQNNTNLIEYSNIFLYSGYGVIEKKNSKRFETFLFLRPFPYLHWLLIILISFISFVSISCLEFNSPFG